MSAAPPTRRRAAAAMALALGMGTTRRLARAASPEVTTARRSKARDGDAWRFTTPHGPARVFRPTGYHSNHAWTVVYVHGLRTSVDRAWRDHDLARQFARSGRNALFVAAPGRQQTSDPPPWASLQELLSVVGDGAGVQPPDGPIALAGHSGAYSQLAVWLENPKVARVLLLDGFYGRQEQLQAWLQEGSADARRLALVGHDTDDEAQRWAADLPYAVRRARFPRELSRLTRHERRAQVLVAGTPLDHTSVIRDGWILPMLLRWADLPRR